MMKMLKSPPPPQMKKKWLWHARIGQRQTEGSACRIDFNSIKGNIDHTLQDCQINLLPENVNGDNTPWDAWDNRDPDRLEMRGGGCGVGGRQGGKRGGRLQGMGRPGAQYTRVYWC